MTKYEYTMVVANTETLKALNALGREGWRVVAPIAAHSTGLAGGGGTAALILERELPN